jgi:hypothetical protein
MTHASRGNQIRVSLLCRKTLVCFFNIKDYMYLRDQLCRHVFLVRFCAFHHMFVRRSMYPFGDD